MVDKNGWVLPQMSKSVGRSEMFRRTCATVPPSVTALVISKEDRWSHGDAGVGGRLSL